MLVIRPPPWQDAFPPPHVLHKQFHDLLPEMERILEVFLVLSDVVRKIIVERRRQVCQISPEVFLLGLQPEIRDARLQIGVGGEYNEGHTDSLGATMIRDAAQLPPVLFGILVSPIHLPGRDLQLMSPKAVASHIGNADFHVRAQYRADVVPGRLQNARMHKVTKGVSCDTAVVLGTVASFESVVQIEVDSYVHVSKPG